MSEEGQRSMTVLLDIHCDGVASHQAQPTVLRQFNAVVNELHAISNIGEKRIAMI